MTQPQEQQPRPTPWTIAAQHAMNELQNENKRPTPEEIIEARKAQCPECED